VRHQILVSYIMYSLFQERTETVDLSSDSTLLVDISDALSEKDKVKFTVHTKVTFDCLFLVGLIIVCLELSIHSYF